MLISCEDIVAKLQSYRRIVRTKDIIILFHFLIGIIEEAFTFCPLKEFRIPQGVQILDYAVLANTLIREITIPEGVTEINNSAFYECTQLQKVILPQSLQSIWEKAFRYCSSLTEIEVPSSVWHITDDVFEGCTSLRHIILHSKVIDSLCWVPEGAELIKQFDI